LELLFSERERERERERETKRPVKAEAIEGIKDNRWR